MNIYPIQWRLTWLIITDTCMFLTFKYNIAFKTIEQIYAHHTPVNLKYF